MPRSNVSNAKLSSQENGQRSSISCLTCRRRKIKCDRKFPQCRVCEQTSQTCNYPSTSLKPGPKIGSQRKRPRTDEPGDDDGSGQTPMPRFDRTAPEIADHQIPTLTRNPARETSSTQENHTSPKPSSTHTVRISDLSFILHPSHETSSPVNKNDRTLDARRSSSDPQLQYAAVDRACSTLGVRQKVLQDLIKTYFDNMVAITLFHEPSFSEKLARISSPTQLSALLAAMLTFAIRFYSDEHDEMRQCEDPQTNTNQQAARFLDIAQRCIDNALEECGDSTPPLCVLQASVVASHCQLTQGVLGRAWRSLGTCVTLAYEMNLHLLDVRGPRDDTTVDAAQWCEDEEKRRAWWAIWEMDVFATTIRRTPTNVDWLQIETLLPVEDEHWFQRKPRASCFLERDPVYRWEALENSGNQSPKAWFIVINSLMKDAQRISSPRGVPNMSPLNDSHPPTLSDNRSNGSRPPDRTDEARQVLETIANAVQCFRLALPSHLKYHGQYLGFEARVPGQYSSSRQKHFSIYNIHMMIQLARLMISRYDVFKGHYQATLSAHDSSRRSAANPDRSHLQGNNKDEMESLAVKQYFEAADEILAIIHRSSDDHIRYINPFLSSTIWLASAVHLLRSCLCRPGTHKSVVKSRFKVMHLTYKKCVRFWGMQTTVQKNLGSLEEQLEAYQRSEQNAQENSTESQDTCQTHIHPTSREMGGNQERDDMPMSLNPNQTSRGSASHRTGVDFGSPASYVPNNNADDINTASLQDTQPDKIFPTPPSSHGFFTCPTTDWQANKAPGDTSQARTQGTSMLDSMHFPPQVENNNPNHACSASIPNPITTAPSSSETLIDPKLFYGTTQTQSALPENGLALDSFEPDFDWNWRYPRLPSDLQDMLSGFFTA